MTNRTILVAAVGVACLVLSAGSVRATTISQWTFETSSAGISGSGNVLGPLAAEVGNGNAWGYHASSSSAWTSPLGNGSAESFSGNRWAAGDYFQFQLSTVGYRDLSVTWHQTRSDTGPGTFDFAWSVDGASFTKVGAAYVVGAVDWSAGSLALPTYSIGMASILPLNNAPSIYLRLTATSAGTHWQGTSRVDNFTVSGTPVPESSARVLGWSLVLTLLGVSLEASRQEARRRTAPTDRDVGCS